MSELPIDYDDVARAAARLAEVAHRTPVITSRRTDERVGASVFFKAENLQRTGSFKFRGAYNAVSELVADGADGVVAYSSGNHAQAVALAARLHDIAATIVMPDDAPAAKLAATRGYGAEVVSYDRYTQDRVALGLEVAQRLGCPVVPPFNFRPVMAGQGTAAAELIEDVGPLDKLFVCVGGGGLISGSATAARHLSPGVEVVGVEPEAGNDAQLSLRADRIVTIDVPRTIADGAQTTAVGDLTFPVMRARVDRIETVSDAELIEAMAWMARTTKLVVEPTGVLALASVLFGDHDDLAGRRIGVILSGGNVDPADYGPMLASASV